MLAYDYTYGCPYIHTYSFNHSFIYKYINSFIYAYIYVQNIGTLLGGFLSSTWLGKAEPDYDTLSNVSLRKYLPWIKYWGGGKIIKSVYMYTYVCMYLFIYLLICVRFCARMYVCMYV